MPDRARQLGRLPAELYAPSSFNLRLLPVPTPDWPPAAAATRNMQNVELVVERRLRPIFGELNGVVFCWGNVICEWKTLNCTCDLCWLMFGLRKLFFLSNLVSLIFDQNNLLLCAMFFVFFCHRNLAKRERLLFISITRRRHSSWCEWDRCEREWFCECRDCRFDYFAELPARKGSLSAHNFGSYQLKKVFKISFLPYNVFYA